FSSFTLVPLSRQRGSPPYTACTSSSRKRAGSGVERIGKRDDRRSGDFLFNGELLRAGEDLRKGRLGFFWRGAAFGNLSPPLDVSPADASEEDVSGMGHERVRDCISSYSFGAVRPSGP